MTSLPSTTLHVPIRSWGDLDSAMDLLEKVLPHRSSEQILWFKNDSDLDPVRSHPRYQKLLESVGDQRAPTK